MLWLNRYTLACLTLFISACGLPEATAVPAPVEVTFADPLAKITEGVRLEPPAHSWDGYGEAVAVYDDLLVIGASEWNYYGPGLAYVYRFSGGEWQAEGQLAATQSRRFGSSVAIGDGVIAIGAPGRTYPIAAGYTGEVYLFEHDGQTWLEMAKLIPGHPDPNAAQEEVHWPLYDRMKRRSFGALVALHGDTLATGVDPATDSVSIYRRGEHGWQEQTPVTIPGLPERISYLVSMALFGDTLALSVLHLPPQPERTPFLTGRVIVYVFERTDDAWQESFRYAPEGEADLLFLSETNVGASVALGGETQQANLLVIGLPGFPDWREIEENVEQWFFGVDPEEVPELTASVRQTGAVHLFERGENGRWQPQATLKPAGWENPPGPGRIFYHLPPSPPGPEELPPLPPSPSPEELPPVPEDEAGISEETGLFTFLDSPEIFVFPGHIFSEAPEISFFGATVALDGNQLAVTAGFANITYLFERQGQDWLYRFKISPVREEGTWEDWAQVVAISGDTLLLGTPGEFGNSAYVFFLPADANER